jgi:signal transduction histidine kinase
MATQDPTRTARGLSAWLRTALPDVVPDAPGQGHGRRARAAGAAAYLVGGVMATATLIDTWEEHPPALRVVAILVGIATLVSLRWRHDHPGAVGIGIGILALVIITASGANLVATFNAAVRARGRDLAMIAGLGVGWAVVNPLLYPPSGSYWFDAGASLLMAGVALGWGLFVRARREFVHALRQQAHRAGDDARAAERRRIAREMHDVLAHRLSLLSVHAGALEFRGDASGEEVAHAAGVIRESARAALTDLRDVVGILREDGSDTLTEPPQPTLEDLPALVQESRDAGMRLTAEIDLGDAGPGPTDAAGRTAYRIAQEGLTNARKHAPGAAVTLTVRAADGGLQIAVRSLAPVAVPAAAALPGTGSGLIGLAERVSLAGGELESGVDPTRAFVLRARLPR